MTPLGNITTNHLALTCGVCGHTSLVSVLSLIEELGKDVRVDEASAYKIPTTKVRAFGTARRHIIKRG